MSPARYRWKLIGLFDHLDGKFLGKRSIYYQFINYLAFGTDTALIDPVYRKFCVKKVLSGGKSCEPETI
jgi:hypothetical protein